MTSSPKPSAPASKASPNYEVRKSPVHGNGVFARSAIGAGEKIIEYRGERIEWDVATQRAIDGGGPVGHTFFFTLADGRVIDGGKRGNDARWINHACAPNCEADEAGGRIFIRTLRKIKAGEELNYDYGLVIDEKYTPELLAEYPCRCCARVCRGTLLSPKD